jgi:hypothetical protein
MKSGTVPPFRCPFVAATYCLQYMLCFPLKSQMASRKNPFVINTLYLIRDWSNVNSYWPSSSYYCVSRCLSDLMCDLCANEIHISSSSPQKRPRGPREGIKLLLCSFFNLGARWGGWSTPRPDCCTPRGRAGNHFYRRLNGPQGRSRWVQKTLPPLAFDLRTVHPVASRYTDWAIPTR